MTHMKILLTLLMISSAFAADTKSDSVKYVLPEQTVTGSRSTERWLDNATSISALSKIDQPTVRGLGISDNLLLIPGLAANTRFGTDDMRLSMRGMGARSNTGERSVRILYDGIPESEPDGQTRLEGVEVGNLSQIEVLRGAGSALYGNAAGGVLSLRTLDGFRRTGVMADVEAGGFGYVKGRVAVGTKAPSLENSPTVSLDLKNMKLSAGEGGEGGMFSFSEIKSDGWRDHAKYEAQLLSGSWRLHSTTASSLKAMLYFVNAKAELPGELTVAQFEADPNQADTIYTYYDVKRFTRKGRLGLSYTHNYAHNISLNFTPYVSVKKLDRARENGEYQRITRYLLGSALQGQWDGMIGERKTRLVAGFDNQLMDGPVTFYENIHGESGDSLLASEQEREWQMGGFVQGDMDFSEKWSGTLGARMEKVESEGIPLSGGEAEDPAKEKELEPAFIPRVGLRYRPADEITVYGTAYMGYETPTLMEKENSNAQFDIILVPQSSLTEELGVRGDQELKGADFQWEATFYHMAVDDFIMPAVNLGEKRWMNAGQSDHMGIELSGKIAKPGLGYVGVAASFGDFKFTDFTRDGVSYKDKKIPGVSPNLVSGMVRWTPRDFFYAEVNARASDKAFVNTDNTIEAGAWGVLGAAIGGTLPVKFIGASWHLAVANLTDETYASFIQVNDSKGRYFESGMPRTIFGGISLGTPGIF
jgi:iron complex outermembrane receptor protein